MTKAVTSSFMLALLGTGVVLAAPPFHVQSLEVRDGTVWAGTFGKGLLRSTDEGRTWVQVPLPKEATSRVLSVAWEGATLFAGTESTGLWTSTSDGSLWQREEAIPPSASVEGMCVGGDGSVWAGTWDDGLFRYRRGRWERVGGWTYPAAGPVVTSIGDRIFVGTLGDGLYYSDDQGESWRKAGAVAQEMSIAAIVEVPGKGLFLASVDGAVLHSTDQGSTWVPVARCAPQGSTVYQLVWSAEGLSASSSNGIFVSRDAGASWSRVPAKDSLPAGKVLWVDGSDGARYLPSGTIRSPQTK